MTHTQQRGATLLVTLIFLALMTLFSLNAYHTGNNNVRVVGNMQARQEALSVAEMALETTLSSTLFATNPQAVAANPITADIDGDGTVDYSAQLNPTPRCYRTRIIKNNELNPAIEADVACMSSGVAQQSGLVSAATNSGDSLCADSEWNIASTVTDVRTGTQVRLNQGVGVRVLVTDATNACPGIL